MTPRMALIPWLLLLAACGSPPPIRMADHVDLDRFMGDWYVIANIPTFIEQGAHNAVESYRLNEDGTVATTFTFRDGGFDGERRTYHPTGYILDRTSNAVWGMQFLWPFTADYRIVYVDDAYSLTIIGRVKRDYVWLMARAPRIPDDDYHRLLRIIESEGYDLSEVQRVPQRWDEAAGVPRTPARGGRRVARPPPADPRPSPPSRALGGEGQPTSRG